MWAIDNVKDGGTPTGKDLTEGMIKNGVDQGRVPLGVKFFLPALRGNNYKEGQIENMTLFDIAGNPGKVRWITEAMHKFESPFLPIIHPNDDFTSPDARLVWKDLVRQDIPIDCLTDWYYDYHGNFINPADGDRCKWRDGWDTWHQCRKGTKRRSEQPPPPPSQPVHKVYARSLVIDSNPIPHRAGSGTKHLCESPTSKGPSYANQIERQFCRMTDRTLWPFCDHKWSSNCFDVDNAVLVLEADGDETTLGKRDAQWELVEHWHTTDTHHVRSKRGDNGELTVISSNPKLA